MKPVNSSERLAFIAMVAVLALVPVSAGLAGVLLGPRFLGAQSPWPADLGSHLRFLSGIFLAMGLAWCSCLFDLKRTASCFRLLGLLTVAGGVARLLSLTLDGQPSTGHLVGLFFELVLVPFLLVWHRRICAAS